MKNKRNVHFVRLFGIIALVTVIVFSMLSLTGCDDGGPPAAPPDGSGSLPAPTGLTAMAISSTEINLTWDAVADASGYRIYQSLSPSTGFIAATTVLSNTAVNNNLPSNTTIYYKVAALDINGIEGPKSNVAAATTLPFGSSDNGNAFTSAGDYSELEPDMDDNPYRIEVRMGTTKTIDASAALFPSATSATFTINSADTAASIASQSGTSCTVMGVRLGSARLTVTSGAQTATVIIVVTPNGNLYTLPDGQEIPLGSGTDSDPWWSDTRPDNLPSDIVNYRSEPSYQLAWNWRNPTQSFGASGTPCGIDILAYYVDPANNARRGWVRTTYGFGGWHYDLNGVSNAMTNGVQVNGNVRLEIRPRFIYDNGVPYLQITHILTNTGSTALTGQKFGASADVMIYGNDRAPLTYMPYGALMTDQTGTNLPKIKLRLICQNLQGIDNVSTLWLGRFGSERTHVYEDARVNVTETDSALNFSYQNISLAPGQSRTFVIRYTQVQ